MKVILSRKGFDSSNGGIASPIFEDGTMISFPIPSDDEYTYSDFVYDGVEYAKMLKDLRYKGGKHCHPDPDLEQTRRKRNIRGWVPGFGQIGAAATYLKNIGVEKGDLFLFFGNFHFVEEKNGKMRYVRNTGDFYKDNDIQVIWGYLQVGEILDTAEKQKKLKWHPHADSYRTCENTNVIFKATKTLSFDPSKPGAGLLTFNEKRVLTRYGCNKATWKRNDVYDEHRIYGNRKNSAKDRIMGIYYSGIWQELGLKESDECTQWAKHIISDKKGVTSNVLLTAECHNWGLCTVFDWRETKYTLRSDGTLTVVTFEGENITETKCQIPEKDMAYINKHIDKGMEQGTHSCGCDGVAWRFQHRNHECELGYVFGTDLEKIANILIDAEDR